MRRQLRGAWLELGHRENLCHNQWEISSSLEDQIHPCKAPLTPALPNARSLHYSTDEKSHIHTSTYSHVLSYTLTLYHIHTRTHVYIYNHTYTFTLTHTQSLVLTHMFTHTHTSLLECAFQFPGSATQFAEHTCSLPYPRCWAETGRHLRQASL